MAVTYNLKGTTNSSFQIGKKGVVLTPADNTSATTVTFPNATGTAALLESTQTFTGAITFDASGNSVLVSDTLRIAQSGSGLRMTNVGAFDNDGSDNFRIYGTNSLYLRANGENGGGLSIDSTNQDVTVDNDLIVGGNLTVQGTTTTVDSTTVNVQNAFVFEGATANDFETTLTVTDPTADRTITLPDATGTVVLADATQTLTNKTLGATTISGHLTPSANVTYDLGTSSLRFRDIYLSGTTIDLGGAKLTNDGSDNLDIKDSSGNRKIIRASAIELVDSSGKKMKLERDATSGKLKQTRKNADGSDEGSSDTIDIVGDTSPQLGGTLDANGNTIDMGTNTITDTKVGEWDTAYSWGDHSTQSYLSGDVGFPTDLGLITGSASTFPIGTNSDFGTLTGDTFVGLGLEDLGVIRQEVTATSTDTLSNKTLSAPSVTGAIELAVTSDPSIVTDKAHVYAKDADADAVTNLLTHSEQFDNSAWVDGTLSALSTVTANDGTDPLGGSTADRISGGTGTSMRAQQTGVSYTNGTTYTFSVYIKGTSGQTVGVGRYNPTQDGDVTVTTHTLDGTWQRLSHTFTATATNSGGRVVISGNGDKSQTATDFLVWGAQLEAGASSPSVYVQTTTASATGYEQKAEVYVKDESGNVTKISPHNQQGEWEYYSRNVMTGKVVRINMEEMIRDIESLTGKSYIKHD